MMTRQFIDWIEKICYKYPGMSIFSYESEMFVVLKGKT